MRAISDLINLDVDNLLTNPKSYETLIYGDTNFSLHQGNYDPYKLLLVGFLYCTFSDVETHASDMWLLINPKLYDTISKTTVKALILDLMYISII